MVRKKGGVSKPCSIIDAPVGAGVWHQSAEFRWLQNDTTRNLRSAAVHLSVKKKAAPAAHCRGAAIGTLYV